ncbi:MAG: ABC transporter ATP-binding protein [Treponema sp.]|jgi:ATP-binding cassette subfamily B protein/ATP-binding cassette subfamily C protein|nr:ABC transporter ATP-binding protein [Treponema sp.]
MKIDVLLPVIGKLYRLLSGKHKAYLAALTALTIGLSLVETIGISIIMPFISMASEPGLLDSGWYKKAFDLFGFADKKTFIVFFGAAIIVFYLFRAVYSVGHIYSINRFSQAMYKYFSQKLFTTFLSIPYRAYAQKNSAVLTQIIGESANVSSLALNVLQAASEIFTVLFVYTLMVVMNWKMTLVLTVFLLCTILSFLRLMIKKSKAQGIKRLESSRKLSCVFRETFGNFKFVKLKGNEEGILRGFNASLDTYSRSQVATNTIGIMPKTILESIGFSLLVAAVIAILWIYHDASRVIPIISMYALALYRILPAMHRLLGNVNNIAYMQHALDIVDENLRLPVETEGTAAVSFNTNIRLENISFSYIEGTEVLRSVSLEIRKGEKIAITGESGCGKSTLVDVIIGIHKPTDGTIYIDDVPLTSANIRAWRSNIGYIPQSIYLFDGTVAENVAFGSRPDEAKIQQALQTANIWDFLTTKEGIHTRVGEGGIQLSGGQQQRIGIARALYDDPGVLVLDEATSALDTETEEKIMDEIYSVSKNKTLIVIAHRLSTVERCDRKIRMENGGIFDTHDRTRT